jgi:RNA polymerase sigma factor (sigma-70 family)
MDLETEHNYVVKAQSGDKDALFMLIRLNIRLILREVKRLQGWANYDDSVAAAIMGYIEGVKRFDVDRGVRVWTYATHWIRARVQVDRLTLEHDLTIPNGSPLTPDSTRKDYKPETRQKIQDARRPSLRLDRPVGDTGDPVGWFIEGEPDIDTWSVEHTNFVRDAVAQLPNQSQRLAVTLRMDLDSYQEVSDWMGMSRQGVMWAAGKARENLKPIMQAMDPDGDITGVPVA